jgi:hypothetical protein
LSIIVCALAILRADASSMALGNRTFVSPNKQYRFETIPDWTGVQPGSDPTVTKGVLSKQDKAGGYSNLWSVTLANPCGPATALVPDNGQYVVTLGDWLNKEENFVVVYGSNGRLIRRLSLDDLLRETSSSRPPVFDQKASLIYHDGQLVGGNGPGPRPWLYEPRIDETNERLSFLLRATTVPDFNKFVLATSWKYPWEKKQVTIQLRTGRIW